jgi:hypothetical protein
MKILDNEAETIVNLTDVKDEQHLQTLLDKEDTELTDVMFDTPFFAMSLKDYQEQYGEQDFTDMDVKSCTYESWMTEAREWAKGCLSNCE